MNHYLSVLNVLLFSLFFSVYGHDYDPLVVAVIMIKNEETVIEKTLQPLVDGGIDSFFIFDTGSTDNTVAVTQKFFNKNNITKGYIEEEPFIDFATSRNHALERAEKRFPNAGFMLMLDAEWYLSGTDSLLTFCNDALTQDSQYYVYMLKILNQAIDFYVPRLIRCNRNVRFEGVVHEIIYCSKEAQLPNNVYFEYLPAATGVEASKNRFKRDREILYKEHHKNPKCSRTLFYLARTCEDLGNLEEAYELYQQRIKLVGWPEEDFMSVYRLAQTVEKLSHTNPKYTWHEALNYYLDAHAMRPHRAEPLISIAHYYVQQNELEKAYIFARRAVEIPYPKNDVLFVQKYAYLYVRHELLARCAWYIKHFNDELLLGQHSAKKAYKAHPEYHHAKRNVELYQERTGIQTL